MGLVSDEVLIEQVLGGNTRLYGELMTRYQDMVFWLACRILRRREEAEDAVQQIFLRAYSRLDTYDGDKGSFWAWIRRITVNVCLTMSSREKPYEMLDELANDADFIFSSSVEEGMLARVRTEDIRKIISDLPSDYRVVTVLRYQEDLSYKEIADLLGVTIPTLQVRLHRAKKMLAERLESVL